MPYMLGRKPRIYNPAVPHMSALMAGRFLPPIPDDHDYTTGMPPDVGMMLNDQLGDCTVAGLYHGKQVWSFNAGGTMVTESDATVLKAYEVIDGYNPADPSTDQGGIEQHVLAYGVRHGIPLDNGGQDTFAAFVEIDIRNFKDIKRGIFDCGFVYIGFRVPDYLMNGQPPQTWDFVGQSYSVVGGHCVICPGYTAANVLRTISWGYSKYQITPAFWHEFVDEAYVIADAQWVANTGKTPAGFTLDELQRQMRYLRA